MLGSLLRTRRLADEGVLTREEKVLLLAEMSDNPKDDVSAYRCIGPPCKQSQIF